MESQTKTLIDKIKDKITENGGLTPAEIAAEFLGIKNPSAIHNKLVEKIFKDYCEFGFDGNKWVVKEVPAWEKAQFSNKDFEHAPESFGVFGFYDENKKIIFVGSASNLREKLLELSENNENTPENIKELHKIAASFITSPAENEEKALDIEKKLISKHQPKLNQLF